MEPVVKLKGVVQHYSWGGTTFIPSLLRIENKDQKPFAEYWLGAHPASPATISSGNDTSLYEAIKAAPEQLLGKRVQKEFGALPYLFKILDVRQMLSIQVHPSIESAVKGYAEENDKDIPLKAPHRNYKDENHKPELMAALGDFWLLHGFKNEADMQTVFETVPELSALQTEFAKGGYKGLYEKVMTMPQEDVNRILLPLVRRVVPLYEAGSLQRSEEDFWAARAVKTFCREGHYDRGIFSIYFFNLLHLKKGEGIYQPAGLPHAYLEGQNVEVMANSDNVLRAGLTDKHIDVGELMKHVRFEATIPNIIRAREENEQVYETPAKEFELTRLLVSNTRKLRTESATIVFAYEGKLSLNGDTESLRIERGEAALVLANQEIELRSDGETAVVFAVTTPVGKN